MADFKLYLVLLLISQRNRGKTHTHTYSGCNCFGRVVLLAFRALSPPMQTSIEIEYASFWVCVCVWNELIMKKRKKKKKTETRSAKGQFYFITFDALNAKSTYWLNLITTTDYVHFVDISIHLKAYFQFWLVYNRSVLVLLWCDSVKTNICKRSPRRMQSEKYHFNQLMSLNP